MDFDARVPIPPSFFPSSYKTKVTKETLSAVKLDKKHLDAKTIGAGIVAAAALKKSKKGKKESASSSSSSSSSASSSSSSSSSSDSSSSASEETGSEFTKESVSVAAIPIRAHPEDKYHHTHHHSDNFHSNHVHLDSYPEIEVPRAEDNASVKSFKKDFSFGGAFTAAAAPEYSAPEVRERVKVYKCYPESVSTEDSVPIVPEKKRHTKSSAILVEATKTKVKGKMGRSRVSDHHHHHLEHIGSRIDDVLHPSNRYQRSLKAQSVSGGEYYASAKIYKAGGGSSPSAPAQASASVSSNFTIPCHHIRIGDLVILQQRPCQVIRITTSAQTGQHRYLGVDLFTKQLHEEPCVVTHPSPSVVLHSMLTPGFKQYRLIDIADSGSLVVMTESGEVKHKLPVVDQGQLFEKVKSAYGNGSGAVKVLVVNDNGKELIVDFKIQHLGQKL